MPAALTVVITASSRIVELVLAPDFGERHQGGSLQLLHSNVTVASECYEWKNWFRSRAPQHMVKGRVQPLSESAKPALVGKSLSRIHANLAM